jgi:DNA-binding NarL/FixJ family response regulator
MNGIAAQRDKFRLLIVDDHGLFREGLVAMCRTVAGVEAAATGAEEAVWMVGQFAADVVLINVTLADGDPFQTARKILARRPPPRLLFLDDAISPSNIRAAVELGGHGYWTRRASLDQLAEALRCVASGELSYCPVARRYLVPSAGGLRFQPPSDCRESTQPTTKGQEDA